MEYSIKFPSNLNAAFTQAITYAETTINGIHWALNLLQKTTKVSATAIELLKSDSRLNKILPAGSKLTTGFFTAIKVNQLCGLIELPIAACSVGRAIGDELKLLRYGLTFAQISEQLENMRKRKSITKEDYDQLSMLVHHSASCGIQYSIFTSILYIFIRVIECIRPLNNAMDFLDSKVHIPAKWSTFTHKWMGPSLIVTSSYLAFRIMNDQILFEYELPTDLSTISLRQYYLDLISSISRISVGIFMTLSAFTKKPYKASLNVSIMAYFTCEALSFAHRKYYHRYPPKRAKIKMLANPF